MRQSKNKRVTLADLAAQVGAEITGDGAVVISGVNTIEAAGDGELSFVANKKYAQFITKTRASALVLDFETPCDHLPGLRHANPYLTFARIIDILFPIERTVPPGVHASARIDPEASIAASAGIGPLCDIQTGVSIGENSQLVSGVFVGRHSTIGKNCLIYPGVRILAGTRIGNDVILHPGVVLGSDGYGYAEEGGGIVKKIQHRGWVEIDDNVEIGANTTIDRGMLGPTRVGEGTKVDNLCQIAHNVQIGKHCRIISQVGISGSTKLGNFVILAGQAGIIGHLHLKDGAIVAAQSGVAKDIEPGKMVLGSPARDVMEAKRIEASVPRLPELLKRVRALEKKLEE